MLNGNMSSYISYLTCEGLFDVFYGIKISDLDLGVQSRAYNLKIEDSFILSSFSTGSLSLHKSMQRTAHLWSNSAECLSLELDSLSGYFKRKGVTSLFSLGAKSAYSSDYMYMEGCIPDPDIPSIILGTNDMSSNIVTASFGMNYLINLQKRAWDTNRKLTTYSHIKITEESFNRFMALNPRTSFVHNAAEEITTELVDDDFFIGISYNPNKVPRSYTLNSAVFFDTIKESFEEALIVEPKDLYIEWVDSVSQGGGLSTKTIPLPKNTHFYEEAYPSLKDQPLKEFISDYLQSDSAVLLLYGPPGTGKTSLLKQIMQYANESCLITYNKDIAAMDTLFSHFYDCPERFLIIEDADTYMSSRAKDGNDVMKKLLNITDGLTARKEKKVIFTTNLTNLNDVDDALLREGRCFATLNVDKLSIHDAEHLLNVMGHDGKSILSTTSKNISLANLYALVAGKTAEQVEEQVIPSFGLGARR